MTRAQQRSSTRSLLFLCLLLCCSLPALGDEGGPQPVELREVEHDLSPPLWQMAAVRTANEAQKSEGLPDITAAVTGSEERTATIPNLDGLDRQFPGPLVSTTDLLNFDGIEANNGQIPPDTNGAVGATQFVQWVNVEFAIYDKTTGHVVQPPEPGNTLWAGFGGPCETNNSGQPIAEYDKAAGRWVMAQSALGNPAYCCIAVSTTSDARGPYNRYAFQFPSGDYPDYGKMAVWPDAYYASFNVYQGSATGAYLYPMVVAYDRTSMLAGSAARPPITFQASPIDFSLLPSDFDGTVPPASGEPNFYLELGADEQSLNLFKFHADFANPANSSFTGPTRIAAAKYKGCASNPPQWGGVTQPSPGAPLNLLGDRLMYRLAWRNLSGVEHLVANHSVMPSTGRSAGAVDWYDLTNPNGAPVISNYGTFWNSSTSYWMGSIAMDKMGDIALGFSASSSRLDPSIEYTGRVPADPFGQMESAKTIIREQAFRKVRASGGRTAARASTRPMIAPSGTPRSTSRPPATATGTRAWRRSSSGRACEDDLHAPSTTRQSNLSHTYLNRFFARTKAQRSIRTMGSWTKLVPAADVERLRTATDS